MSAPVSHVYLFSSYIYWKLYIYRSVYISQVACTRTSDVLEKQTALQMCIVSILLPAISRELCQGRGLFLTNSRA
jgi:hypothetical protein